jgi:hypothetical protein
MAIRPSVALGVVLALGLTTCAEPESGVAEENFPGEMAGALCDTLYTCQCPDYAWPDRNACFTERLVAYNELQQEAVAAGLSYDADCVESEVTALRELACSLPGAPEPELCEQPCAAYHGSSGAGFQCAVLANAADLPGIEYTNCKQGLVCVTGICIDPCVGAPGLPGVGQPCPEGFCQEGLTCDVFTNPDSPICVYLPDLPGIGEQCWNDICDPTIAVCAKDLNICAARPGPGLKCVEGQCTLDSTCNADDVCEALPPVICGAG